MKLHGSMDILNNYLRIGEVSVEKLAKKYGTPLYIYDKANIKSRANEFLKHFQSKKFKTHVYYAAKALANLYIFGLIQELNLFVDVVSEGELYTALKAGVDPAKISLHGNNKLQRELEMALDNEIGNIIIDHKKEYDLLSKLCKQRKQKTRVLLRINPGIEATTHKYIQTSKEDSKFGMSVEAKETYQLLQEISEDPYLELAGVHCHIGSQILDKEFFFQEAKAMLAFVKKLAVQQNIFLEEVNLGGGFGVYYTKEDQPFDLPAFLEEYISVIEQTMRELDLTLQVISIEPGRSLINDSGSILYTVGAVKFPHEGKPFVFVDGGMTDNLRPALYQAKYQACLANRMDEPRDGKFCVAGKCCETGDILIQEVELPMARAGDLLLIPAAGAYTYSMSSNYNRLPKPALVFVEKGKSHLAVRREDYQDLIRNDLEYKN